MMRFPEKERITLAEELENITFFTEKDEIGSMKPENSLFITPSDESDNYVSDENCADKDCTEFDINSLRKKDAFP